MDTIEENPYYVVKGEHYIYPTIKIAQWELRNNWRDLPYTKHGDIIFKIKSFTQYSFENNFIEEYWFVIVGEKVGWVVFSQSHLPRRLEYNGK